MATRHSGKTIPIKQITSWSFSRYSDYKRCPAFAKFKHLDKLPEAPSTAMARGSDIHTQAEQYTLGKLTKIPDTLAGFKEEFALVKKNKAKIVEQQWAFTSDWQPTEWNNWNACWLRVKLDLAYVDGDRLVVVDHKTGQIKGDKHDEYVEQTELYTTSGIAMHLAGLLPKPVKEVVSELWYLDHGIIWPEEVKPVPIKDFPKLTKLWAARTKAMLTDTRFAPRPGNYCRWCSFSKSKEGPCQY